MLDITASTTSGSGGGGGFVLVAVLVLGALYFLPSIIAFSRHVPNAGSVAVINTLLGWSLIGWVVALAMAARSKQPSTSGVPAGAGMLVVGPGVPSDPAAPGWFPDPSGDRTTDRYFDGQRWTATTRPRLP